MEVTALTTVKNSSSPGSLEKICFLKAEFTSCFKWHCGKKPTALNYYFFFTSNWRQILLELFSQEILATVD